MSTRNQAENALRTALSRLDESESRFRSIVSNIPGAVYRARSDGWTFDYVSDAIEHITGYPPQRLTADDGSFLAGLIHPEDLPRARETIAGAIAERRSFVHEFRFFDSRGRLRWASERGTPVLDEATNVLYVDGVIFDITEQKEAEQALRESEEQFASTFAHAAIGMALVAPDGRWLKVNRALCELTGYPEEELLRLTFQDITHPDDLEPDLHFVRQMLTGKIRTYQMEKRYIHKQGHTIWILLSVSLIWDRQDRPLHFIAQIQNITERKKAEWALRESEERFRTAVMNSPAAIFRSTPDGWHIIFVSDAVEAITGYSPAEFAALHEGPLENFYHPEDLPRLKETIRASVKRHLPGNIEYRFRHKSGEIRWALERARAVLDDAGNVKWFDGAILDVTERKLAEAKAKEARQWLETFLERMPSATIKDADNRYVFVNKAMADLVNRDPAEIVGKTPFDIYPKETAERSAADTAIVLRTGTSLQYEEDVLYPGGTRTLLTTRFPLPNLLGDGRRLIGTVGSDVTELNRSRTELAQSAKLATLGEIAAGVVHELNQPLNVIRMATDSCLIAAEETGSDLEFQLRQLHTVSEQCGRMTEIIDQLRIFTRKDSGEFEPFDPRESALKARDLLAQQYRDDNIALIAELPDAPPMVKGIPSRLEQVLINLLTNARDAIKSKRSRTGAEPPFDDTVKISLAEDAAQGRTVIRVLDTGGGIPADILGRIFDPFFTTKGPREGTGLGLSIVYRTVTEMGGTIAARNAEPGAEFTIVLPTVQRGATDGSPGVRTEREPDRT